MEIWLLAEFERARPRHGKHDAALVAGVVELGAQVVLLGSRTMPVPIAVAALRHEAVDHAVEHRAIIRSPTRELLGASTVRPGTRSPASGSMVAHAGLRRGGQGATLCLLRSRLGAFDDDFDEGPGGCSPALVMAATARSGRLLGESSDHPCAARRPLVVSPAGRSATITALVERRSAGAFRQDAVLVVLALLNAADHIEPGTAQPHGVSF